MLAMAHADDCVREMFVLVGFAGRKLGVPLAQLPPIGADAGTREALEDRRYWVMMGCIADARAFEEITSELGRSACAGR